MVIVFPLISLCLLGLIYFTGGVYFQPALILFAAQVILISLSLGFIKLLKSKDIKYLLPIMKQIKYYFALLFTGWIGLAFTGHIVKVVGRIYAYLAIIVFIGLALVALNEIFMQRHLLSQFKEKKEREGKNNDKY